jgi:Fur family transcriptional regulator, ferric uptake regulator
MIDTNELKLIGLKNTKNKATILQMLKSLQRPISAVKLHLYCTNETVMNITTVYRTLEQFKNGGLVRELSGQGGELLYEYSGTDALAHPHFRCDRCKNIICLDPLKYEATLLISAMARKHKVERIELTLSGLCEACCKSEQTSEKNL